MVLVVKQWKKYNLNSNATKKASFRIKKHVLDSKAMKKARFGLNKQWKKSSPILKHKQTLITFETKIRFPSQLKKSLARIPIHLKITNIASKS